MADRRKSINDQQAVLKKKEFAKIFSRSRMKVRHKDYFIYSHGS